MKDIALTQRQRSIRGRVKWTLSQGSLPESGQGQPCSGAEELPGFLWLSKQHIRCWAALQTRQPEENGLFSFLSHYSCKKYCMFYGYFYSHLIFPLPTIRAGSKERGRLQSSLASVTLGQRAGCGPSFAFWCSETFRRAQVFNSSFSCTWWWRKQWQLTHFSDNALIHCFCVIRANVNIGKRANNMTGLLQKHFDHVGALNKSWGLAELCRPHFANHHSVASFENTNNWT